MAPHNKSCVRACAVRVSDYIDSKVKEIEQRLCELQPYLSEFHQLEAARGALEEPRTPPGQAPREPRR